MISEISNESTLKRMFKETREEIRKVCLQTSLSLLLCWGHLVTVKPQVPAEVSALAFFPTPSIRQACCKLPADKTQPLAIGMTFIAKSYCTFFTWPFSQ